MLYRYAILAVLLCSIVGTAYAQEVRLGASSKTVEVGKQVQIAADLKNNQDFEQEFAYIVQIQNEDGVTVSLAWITGVLTPAQSFTPSLSWTPNEAGSYEATIFVWESIDNPSALSPTLSLKINVGQAT
jgi:predicted secreted hydrolase